MIPRDYVDWKLVPKSKHFIREYRGRWLKEIPGFWVGPLMINMFFGIYRSRSMYRYTALSFHFIRIYPAAPGGGPDPLWKALRARAPHLFRGNKRRRKA